MAFSSKIIWIPILTIACALACGQDRVYGGGIVAAAGSEKVSRELRNQLFMQVLEAPPSREEFLKNIDHNKFEVHFVDRLAILIDMDLVKADSLSSAMALMEYLKSRVTGLYTVIKYDSLPEELKDAYLNLVAVTGTHNVDMSGHTFLLTSSAGGELVHPEAPPVPMSINFANYFVSGDEKNEVTHFDHPEIPEIKPFKLISKKPVIAKSNNVESDHIDIFLFGLNQAETGETVTDFYFGGEADKKRKARMLGVDIFDRIMGSKKTFYAGTFDPEGQEFKDLPHHLKVLAQFGLLSGKGKALFTDPVTGYIDRGKVADFLAQCSLTLKPEVSLQFSYRNENGELATVVRVLASGG